MYHFILEAGLKDPQVVEQGDNQHIYAGTYCKRVAGARPLFITQFKKGVASFPRSNEIRLEFTERRGREIMWEVCGGI